MNIFRRITRAISGADNSLGSTEGSTEGTTAFTPGLRHIEAAERQEFPPEEFAAGEQEESE